MGLFKEELKKAKISLFLDDNMQIYCVILYNMGKVKDFKTDLIAFNNCRIVGNHLKIVKMEENIVEIEGQITKIFNAE